MSSIWFATREDVRAALSAASTACDDAAVDRALDAATQSVIDLCQRDFAPVLATRYKDWPNAQTAPAWRVWLDRDELISATTVVSGGVTIPPTDYWLEPANSGPPYNRIETRLDRPSAYSSGDTHQRSLAISGLFGHSDVQATAGTLTGAINTTVTSLTLSEPVGVGTLLSVGAERMVVTGKKLAYTGQTLQTPLAAQKNAVQADVEDGTAYVIGDVLTLGPERMLVRNIAGNTLTVDRSYDGTLLDSHSGTPIWAPRLLTVQRAAAGTTAAPAADGTTVTRWVPPGLAQALTVAEAMCTLLSEQAGYARTVRSQAGTGTRSVAAVTAELTDLRERVANSRLCRKARMRAV